jgi:uncharacterized Zn ribbon protein
MRKGKGASMMHRASHNIDEGDSMVLIVDRNVKGAVKRLIMVEGQRSTTLLVSDHRHGGFHV